MFLEEELRERVWGDRNIFYENDLYSLREIKTTLYSEKLVEIFDEFECLNFEVVNKERLKDRHFIHQRSYLDFRLRMSDHFDSRSWRLDVSSKFRGGALSIPRHRYCQVCANHSPAVELYHLTEKYILRRIAEGLLPEEIMNPREVWFSCAQAALRCCNAISNG